jgi:hypothetical protein
MTWHYSATYLKFMLLHTDPWLNNTTIILSCGKPSTPAGSEIYTGTEARSPLHKKASNHTKKKTKVDRMLPN